MKGGQRPFGISSENSSVLVVCPVPKRQSSRALVGWVGEPGVYHIFYILYSLLKKIISQRQLCVVVPIPM